MAAYLRRPAKHDDDDVGVMMKTRMRMMSLTMSVTMTREALQAKLMPLGPVYFNQKSESNDQRVEGLEVSGLGPNPNRKP